MAFPTGLALLDDFNRANVNPLDGTWAIIAILGATPMAVASNQAQAGAFGQDASAYWTGATFGNDCGIYLTVATKSANTEFMGLLIRGTNLNNAGTCSYYQLLVTPGAGADPWQIDKVVSGAYTPSLGTGTQEVSNGDKIGLGVVGNVVTAYYNNGGGWTSVCSATDSSVATGGQVGFAGHSTNFFYDDVNGGTLSAGGAATSDSPGIAVARKALIPLLVR